VIKLNCEHFYNRIHEAKVVVGFVETQTKNNKIILVAGKTGIGKSAFIDKILSTELHKRISVRVNICKASPNTIENLYYINAIYRTLADLSNKNLFDNIHSPLQQGLGNIKNLFLFGFDILRDKTVGEGNTLYEPVDERGVLRKKDYIVSILKTQPLIVCIENIQSIDAQSLEILYDIFAQVNNTTFIFEYTTTDDASDDELLSFYNDLKRHNATVYLLEMNRLDYNEAKKLAPSHLDDSQIRKLYQRSNGNLVKIQLATQRIKDDEDPIAFQLTQLSEDERFLANLIYLNDSPICYAELFKMILGNLNAPPFTEDRLQHCLAGLDAKRIIRISHSGEVRIYHDSIIEQLNAQPASVSLYVAYSVIKEYYMVKLSSNQVENAVEHLFCLFIRFSDVELLSIFPQISRLIRSYKYPQSAIRKLIFYRERIQEKGASNPLLYQKLVVLLVNLCQEYGLWEEALNNLSLIYSNTNPYHRAMKAAALSLDFTNDQSINEIQLLIKQATSPREKLTTELCLLSAEMARQPREKSKRMAERMLSITEYQDCMEYAFLQSNYAELVHDSSECINLYKQAVERLHLAGRDDLCANILVFLSMIYAYEGNLSVSHKILDSGRIIGSIADCYLLNNYAVLDILSGKANTNTAKQLCDALLLTCDPYERILIQCNLLVCYVLIDEKVRSAQVAKEIAGQKYEQFQYEEFLHIVYQDLYFYYKTVRQNALSEKYRECLFKLIERGGSNSMFWQIAKLQYMNQSSPKVFFSRFPFRVDFLGSWSIEISSDLENS